MTATLDRPRMDPRFRERRVKIAREQGRRRLRILCVVAAVIGVLAVPAVVLMSPLLAVRVVHVEGLPPDLTDDVVRRTHHLVGSPIVFASASAVHDELLTDPRLDAVSVRREFPHTIRIIAARRVPAAVARVEGGYAVVAHDGVVLAISHIPPPDLPGLRAAGLPVQPGLRAESLVDALAAHGALPATVAERVIALEVTADHALILHLDGGVTVAFGDPSDRPERKGQVLESLMTRAVVNGWTVKSYSVVAPDAPAVVPL